MRLQEKYGYCEVQLRVTFMRGLHPFYPPTVELVRPRMSPVVACALASHPLLCLERWDPWKPCAELLYELKAFLQVLPRFPIVLAVETLLPTLHPFLFLHYSLAVSRRENLIILTKS